MYKKFNSQELNTVAVPAKGKARLRVFNMIFDKKNKLKKRRRIFSQDMVIVTVKFVSKIFLRD